MAAASGNSATERKTRGSNGVAVALFTAALVVLAGSLLWLRSHNVAPSSKNRDAAVQEHYQRGLELIRTGDTRGAEETLLTAIALDPGFAPAHFAIADMYDSAGRPVLAAEKLKPLLAANANTPHVLCRQAELYLKAGGFEKGVRKARDELQRDPRCVLANSVMGMALMLAGDGKGAVDHLRAAHEAAPNDVRIARMYAQVLGEAGRAKDGLPIAEQLAHNDPTSPQAEYLVGWLQSKASADRESLQQAIQHLTKALSMDSDYAPASGALGVALSRMGSPETAITLLERARQAGSFDLDTARALADVSAKLKRPNAPELAAQARDMAASDDKLQKARAEWLTHPDNMQNTLALARMEGARGDLPDAREMVIGILRNDPNQPEALSILEELMARR